MFNPTPKIRDLGGGLRTTTLTLIIDEIEQHGYNAYFVEYGDMAAGFGYGPKEAVEDLLTTVEYKGDCWPSLFTLFATSDQEEKTR